jgi:hypothetical protein
LIPGSSQLLRHGGEVQLQISHLKFFYTNKFLSVFAGNCGSKSQTFPRRIFQSSAVSMSAVLLIFSNLFLAGCGGGNSSSSNTVTVTITPPTATLSASQTTSFTATVANTSNTAVTWSVNGTQGGNATYGTITSSGVYTAPATITTTVTETITATSAADTTKSASASVTLTPNASASSKYVTVSPSSLVILSAGAEQTFAATVNSAPVSVTWKVSCKAIVNGDCGKIDATGRYDAPLSPPPGGTVTVTATTTDNSANPGYGTVSIQYSNASLWGQYAFVFSGENGSIPVAAIGSISTDGAGNITGGSEDTASGSSITITGGTYNLGTDGRGAATVQTSAGTSTWRFVVESYRRIFAVTSDATSGTMVGTLDVQDATQFSSAAITGNYALLLSSPITTSSGSALAQIGAITTDGAGTISAGLQDVNTSAGAQASLAVTGTYVAPAATTGRGTLTLSSSFGAQTFTYYMVDGTTLKLLEQNATRASSGELAKQATGPFSVANVKGNFATAIYGSTINGPASFGAQLALDGAGGVTGTADSNLKGNVLNDQAVTGTYTVSDATTGRTQITLTANGKSYSFVAYPGANQGLNIAETDNTIAAGKAYAQTTFVVNGASLGGNFATRLSGTDLVNSGFDAASGQLTLNGGSAITGTLDMNLNNSPAPNTPVSGSYLVDTTSGRVSIPALSASGLFTNASMVLYPIDQTHFLLVETDASRVLVGLAEGQY